MSALSSLLHKEIMRELAIEGEERRIGQEIFKTLRERTIALLCGYLRIQWEAKKTGVKFPEIYHDPDWCNAAIQILTYCSFDVQDDFLRATDDRRTDLVCAVLADGGVTGLDDHFYELPPLS